MSKWNDMILKAPFVKRMLRRQKWLILMIGLVFLLLLVMQLVGVVKEKREYQAKLEQWNRISFQLGEEKVAMVIRENELAQKRLDLLALDESENGSLEQDYQAEIEQLQQEKNRLEEQMRMLQQQRESILNQQREIQNQLQ